MPAHKRTRRRVLSYTLAAVLVVLTAPILVVFAFMQSLPDSPGEFRTHGSRGRSSGGGSSALSGGRTRMGKRPSTPQLIHAAHHTTESGVPSRKTLIHGTRGAASLAQGRARQAGLEGVHGAIIRDGGADGGDGFGRSGSGGDGGAQTNAEGQRQRLGDGLGRQQQQHQSHSRHQQHHDQQQGQQGQHVGAEAQQHQGRAQLNGGQQVGRHQQAKGGELKSVQGRQEATSWHPQQQQQQQGGEGQAGTVQGGLHQQQEARQQTGGQSETAGQQREQDGGRQRAGQAGAELAQQAQQAGRSSNQAQQQSQQQHQEEHHHVQHQKQRKDGNGSGSGNGDEKEGGGAHLQHQWPNLLPLGKGPPLPRPNCGDRNPAAQCRQWSADGGCERNPGFMYRSCSATCGLCTVTFLHGTEVPQTVELVPGVPMPMVGYGTAGLGDLTADAVFTAIRVGYRLIDSAGAREWYREDLVGWGWSASGIKREHLFITSKIHPRHHGYWSTLEVFTEALQDLQTDYLDLMLLHYPE